MQKNSGIMQESIIKRCDWAATGELMQKYHDTEWGVPLHSDRKLFEFMLLDAFQAGLSWAIVLNKREGFRKAFDHFDVQKIAMYDEQKIQKLLLDNSIVRNKLKITATVSNARAFLDVQAKYGSFDKFIWQFTDGRTIQNSFESQSRVPATSPISDKMSKELKAMGFKFVGSTICYAFMQAAGMVNDHLVTCFRHSEVKELSANSL